MKDNQISHSLDIYSEFVEEVCDSLEHLPNLSLTERIQQYRSIVDVATNLSQHGVANLFSDVVSLMESKIQEMQSEHDSNRD